ncbi:hypothetical protein ACJQWK_04261 [Exserohilum turcicum]|uniref:Uncharacterized protein n=1 Tax=Exserohilum turcicum (strain 28A) TaxID=671987 RepID=R0KGD4_EXST2|nr:uncharacterized protein SETTUDRAFT_18584 [Exserohilum turcica Et28A]EOA91923.1 hypothetical protein SETTUDRAFT_18584 [Exserohilum turcica Et28A]
MKALEGRLAATEAALSAALTALRNQTAQDSLDPYLSTAISNPPLSQRSKAEKLEEWKRLPLQTGDQLMAWLRVQNGEDMASPRTDGRRSISEPQTYAAVSPKTVMGLLETCEEPKVPNAWEYSAGFGRWTKNYF